MTRPDLNQAAAAWDTRGATIEDISRRIHDGVPMEQLAARADGIVSVIASLSDFSKLKNSSILEIGSGVGYVMEAVERRAQGLHAPHEIIGLDISATMIEAARQRLADNPAYQNGVLRFVHYDGVAVPFEDGRFDFVYSVAALQHIPKPYVYNLFFEIRRVLKDTGSAVLQFLPFSYLAEQEKAWPWRNEINQQIGLSPSSHWHYFYSKDELESVLIHGTGFRHVDIAQIGTNLWAHLSKSAHTAPRKNWRKSLERT